MIKDILTETEERMDKTLESLRREFSAMRAGRANPGILDRVTVDYYGTATPLNQVCNIAVPEPRLIMLTPWDKGTIGAIEKAILKSDLGLNPANDGAVIRLAIPQLTEERRKDLVKQAKKKAEDAKVALRNIRRDLNDDLKKLEKDKAASEDDVKQGLDQAQKTTDNFIKKIDEMLSAKEKEIMEV